MAKKFSQLTAVSALTSSDITAVVNGGVSKKATLAQVTTFVSQNGAREITLNGLDTTGSTVIGSVYIPIETALTSASVAYIGGLLDTATVHLSLMASGTGTASATWSRTGTLGNQVIDSVATLTAGWYDIVLSGVSGATVFARGLYLA